MADRSRFARILRARAPRWVLLAWIWAALPIGLFINYGCERVLPEPVCQTWNNSNWSAPWSLPTTFMFLAPQDAPVWFAMLFPLAFTVAADLAVRRLVPARVP